MKLHFAIALLALSCAPALAANKCTLPDGRVEYTDAACPSGAKSAAVRDRANSIDTRAGHRQNLSDAQAAQERDAYNRCIQARGDVEHATTLEMHRNRKKVASMVCGDPPPSPEDQARRRERIQRAATIDAINRNTAAVQAGAMRPPKDEPKRIELECKSGILSGTATCTQR